MVTASITEGEGSDRGNLDLPQSVEKLICDIADTGKKVITVISAGSAVTMNNWIDKASAVVYVWYGGCEGSRALRDVIYGKYNPAGRLPVTFPQHVAQLPMYYSAEARGRSSGYNNIPDTPQFEFGYGLSYTEFEYSNIRLSDNHIKANEKTSVTLDIRNVGDCDGEEVVQLYINDLYSSVVTPPIELKDFRRVFIKRGGTERLSFEITPEMLQMLDENLNWIVEPGEFEILIGASCKDIRQKTILIVDGDGNES